MVFVSKAAAPKFSNQTTLRRVRRKAFVLMMDNRQADVHAQRLYISRYNNDSLAVPSVEFGNSTMSGERQPKRKLDCDPSGNGTDTHRYRPDASSACERLTIYFNANRTGSDRRYLDRRSLDTIAERFSISVGGDQESNDPARDSS
jgi:hypothetical protein